MTKLQETTIDALLDASSDIHGDRETAKQYLADLFEQSPRPSWPVVLPIARSLLAFPGWQQLSVADVRDYCLPRLPIVAMLGHLCTDEIDPAAEYMVGLAHILAESIKRDPTHCDTSPDKGPNLPPESAEVTCNGLPDPVLCQSS